MRQRLDKEKIKISISKFHLFLPLLPMNQRQFKEFDLNERMDIVNLNGKYVGVREYYAHKINLYAVYGFFVEVWYFPAENKITKVQVANRELVDLMYADKVNIWELL